MLEESLVVEIGVDEEDEGIKWQDVIRSTSTVEEER